MAYHGFLLSFQMVVFAFVGVELVGVSAAETENPQKNIPSAINKIPVTNFIILCWCSIRDFMHQSLGEVSATKQSICSSI